MGVYRFFLKKSVWKDFTPIPDKDLKKILACIELLGKNPRQSGYKKLSGQEKYRVKYGKYCIIYSIQNKELSIWIVKVGHRKNVYS